MDNHENYLQAQEKIYKRLDRHRPTTSIPVSTSMFNKIKTVVACTMHPAILAAPMAISNQLGLEGVGLAATIMIGMPYLSAIMMEDSPFPALHKAVATRLLHGVGKGLAIDEQDGKHVAYLCNRHPDLATRCQEWIAKNPLNTITSREVRALVESAAQLTAAKDSFNEAQERAAKHERAQNALNEAGLVDRGRSLGSHTLLTNSTPPAGASVSKPRRM